MLTLHMWIDRIPLRVLLGHLMKAINNHFDEEGCKEPHLSEEEMRELWLDKSAESVRIIKPRKRPSVSGLSELFERITRQHFLNTLSGTPTARINRQRTTFQMRVRGICRLKRSTWSSRIIQIFEARFTLVTFMEQFRGRSTKTQTLQQFLGELALFPSLTSVTRNPGPAPYEDLRPKDLVAAQGGTRIVTVSIPEPISTVTSRTCVETCFIS